MEGDIDVKIALIFLAALMAANSWPRERSAQHCVVKRAYVDPSNERVHIVSTDSHDVEIAPETNQVAADPPVIAPDHELVGWSIQEPNCCTSYPIPTSVVLYSCGKIIRRIADGMMVYKWSFLKNGQEIAISTGTVHGMQGLHLSLYNSVSGKLLQTWDGDETEVPPKWGLLVAH